MDKKKIAAPTKKTAFEVVHNGRRISIAGLHGGPGVVNVIIHSVRGEEGGEDLSLPVGGLDSKTDEHFVSALKSLRIGDEIVIRVIDSVKTTRVRKQGKPQSPRRQGNLKKRKMAFMRDLAKQTGYKLVKL